MAKQFNDKVTPVSKVALRNAMNTPSRAAFSLDALRTSRAKAGATTTRLKSFGQDTGMANAQAAIRRRLARRAGGAIAGGLGGGGSTLPNLTGKGPRFKK